MLTVRFVDDCDALSAVLWDRCFQPPREGVWWYRALQRCGVEDQFSFLYGVIEQDGDPVGIAPCFIADVPLEALVPDALMPLLTIPARLFPSLSYQRTLFIGNPCSDEGWVGALPHIDRRQALLAVHHAAQAEARRRKAPMVAWKDVPEQAKADMDWLRRECGLFGLPSYPNAVIRFPGPRKEDYFASLKGSRRHQLRKKLRLSAQAVDITAETVQSPDDAVLQDVFALFQQTFDKADVKFERLTYRFFQILAADPHVHFILLRERSSGDLVSFMMCFVVGDLVINKFIGFDYARPKDWRLYFRLWDAAVDWSLSIGATGIQSGQTCYAPKIEQGHSLAPLFNYGQHANRLMHWIYDQVARRISWSTLDDDLARYLAAHPDHAPQTV